MEGRPAAPGPRGLRPVPYAVGVTVVGGVLGIPAGRWAGRAGKYCRRVNAEPVRAFFGCPLLPGNGKLAYICTAIHSADGPEYETAASNNLQYPLGRASRCRLSRKQTPADGVLRRGEMERMYCPVPSRPGIFLRGGSGREVRPSGVEGTPGRASRKLHGRFRGRFRRWNDTPSDAPLYSSAFSQGIFARGRHTAASRPVGDENLFVCTAFADVRPDETLAIAGDIPNSGVDRSPFLWTTQRFHTGDSRCTLTVRSSINT